jgi:glycosyltransferase involved in cell wall biosynthesis
MNRLLFIARYRDVTMDRKVRLIAEGGGLLVRQIRPRSWEDEFGLAPRLTPGENGDSGADVAGRAPAGSPRQVGVGMIGRASNPHRAIYRTPDFGMLRFRPHLIHAEEEPDSLAALQIALARWLFAPKAKLLLYTWQNVNRPLKRAVRWVMGLTLRSADGVLCANREAVALLRRRGYTGMTEVVPAIGVNTRVFQPCAARPSEGRFRVGYAGRLVAEKGLDTLIEAVGHLEAPAELLLIGEGAARPALEARVRAGGLSARVQFRPPVVPARLAGELCGLDTLVLPSRTTPVWKEQFGRVLTEAMACGVPVVGSDSGAIPEVIGDAGLIFPEGDAVALAACLHQLKLDATLRRELAVRGMARVGRLYSQERIAAATLNAYRKVTGGE